MSAIQIELPEPIHQRAEQLARRQSISLDHLLVVALVEKLATAFPDTALEVRAQRGDKSGLKNFMEGVPDIEPEEFDRLPADSKSEK